MSESAGLNLLKTFLCITLKTVLTIIIALYIIVLALIYIITENSLVAHEEFACNAGDVSSISGLGRSPEEGNGYPLQYSYLENSMDIKAWQATFHRVTKSWTHLSNYTQTHLNWKILQFLFHPPSAFSNHMSNMFLSEFGFLVSFFLDSTHEIIK